MRACFVILLLLTIASFAVAQEQVLQFEKANQAYHNGSFQEAANLYEQIQKNGYESAALYYNLGNSYFKLNKLPEAIISYERAKRLAPHDEDILYNLRLANLRIIDKIDPIPQFFLIEWWKSLTSRMSSGGWALLGILAFWCLAIAVGTLVVSRSGILQRLALFVGFMMLIIGLLSVVSGYQRMQAEQSDQAGILTAPSVSVKSAPDAQSTDLFIIHEGVKVEFLDTVGDWKKIKLADGKVGWLPQESVQVI